MDSVVYYGSAGQHVELGSLSNSLIVPLKSGLSSFITISGILLTINADMVLPGSKDFDDIRRQIMNIKQRMEESERLARTKLEQVDRATETLTGEQSQLAQQKRQKTEELNNLKIKLSSLQSTLNSYKQALEAARRNLRSAEAIVKKLHARKRAAWDVRDFGYSMYGWPFAGAFGTAISGFSQLELDAASEAFDRAQEEENHWIYYVNSYSDEVRRCNSLISQAHHDISATDNKIRETEAKLRDVSEKRRIVADVQDKVRQAVTQLGELSGVGSVAELQTRQLILLEPVMKLLEDMTSKLRQISGNELLYREGIPSLVEKMKSNYRNLKELADSRNSEDINSYI